MSTIFIYNRLIEMRNTEKAILLISEDLDELLLLCDRVYIMYKGCIAGEFTRNQFNSYEIGSLMTGATSTND